MKNFAYKGSMFTNAVLLKSETYQMKQGNYTNKSLYLMKKVLIFVSLVFIIFNIFLLF